MLKRERIEQDYESNLRKKIITADMIADSLHTINQMAKLKSRNNNAVGRGGRGGDIVGNIYQMKEDILQEYGTLIGYFSDKKLQRRYEAYYFDGTVYHSLISGQDFHNATQNSEHIIIDIDGFYAARDAVRTKDRNIISNDLAMRIANIATSSQDYEVVGLDEKVLTMSEVKKLVDSRIADLDLEGMDFEERREVFLDVINQAADEFPGAKYFETLLNVYGEDYDIFKK